MEKFNLAVKIFDLKWKMPKIHNKNILAFVAKFPIMKLIGKNAKSRFIKKIESIVIFLLFKIILILIIP